MALLWDSIFLRISFTCGPQVGHRSIHTPRMRIDTEGLVSAPLRDSEACILNFLGSRARWMTCVGRCGAAWRHPAGPNGGVAAAGGLLGWTLCVPIGDKYRTHRKSAIRKMGNIYEKGGPSIGPRFLNPGDTTVVWHHRQIRAHPYLEVASPAWTYRRRSWRGSLFFQFKTGRKVSKI